MVVRTVAPRREDRRIIECDETLHLDRSSWVAVKAEGMVRPDTFGGVRDWPLLAHSGPVFVSVGGRPIRIRHNIEVLLDHTVRFEECARQQGTFDSAEHRNVFLSNIRDALAVYRQRLKEC
jgi:hypothetical protein